MLNGSYLLNQSTWKDYNNIRSQRIELSKTRWRWYQNLSDQFTYKKSVLLIANSKIYAKLKSQIKKNQRFLKYHDFKFFSVIYRSWINVSHNMNVLSKLINFLQNLLDFYNLYQLLLRRFQSLTYFDWTSKSPKILNRMRMLKNTSISVTKRTFETE